MGLSSYTHAHTPGVSCVSPYHIVLEPTGAVLRRDPCFDAFNDDDTEHKCTHDPPCVDTTDLTEDEVKDLSSRMKKKMSKVRDRAGGRCPHADCGQRFKTGRLLIQHISHEHSPAPRPPLRGLGWRCYKCNKMIWKPETVNTHYECECLGVVCPKGGYKGGAPEILEPRGVLDDSKA